MTNTETFVVATSTLAGPQLRYKLETIGATDVYTDIGHITDYSSGTAGWTIQSTSIGGRGLVNISGDTVQIGFIGSAGSLSGLNVVTQATIEITSGAVIPVVLVSANVGVGVLSAGTIPVSVVSAPASQNIYIIQNPATALSGTAPLNIAVTASSGQVLAVNASRKGAVFTNLSGNIISFGLGTSTNLGLGITLNTLGGTWVMDQFTYTTQQIQAISNISGSGLGVQEFV